MSANKLVFLSLSFLCFATLSFADARFSNARISNARIGGVFAPVSVDPCEGKLIGEAGNGTLALCAGTGYTGEVATPMDPNDKYMALPGRCDGSVDNPTCLGGANTDTGLVLKVWAGNDAAPSAHNTDTGADSTIDGPENTNILTLTGGSYVGYADAYAAQYCQNMVYGGYSDWYLPAKDELKFVLWNNRVEIKGFLTTSYWSSTEGNDGGAWLQTFSSGAQNIVGKTNGRSVRCIRRY